MQRSRLSLQLLAASRVRLNASANNNNSEQNNSNSTNADAGNASSTAGGAASSSSSSSSAGASDGEGFNLNFETKADEAFFRAQEQAKMRSPVDGPQYNQSIPGAGQQGYSKSLPTAAKYRALTNEELIQMLKLRDSQIKEIRLIYENFHNEVEKQYRKQIFDYHDKAISFSQTHGQMQSHSINHTREALTKLREQEELEHRDLKIVYTICFVTTLLFWFYVRRHYIKTSDLTFDSPTAAGEAPFSLRTDGMSLTPNWLNGMMATSRETWFEKEKRLEREAIAKEKKERDEAAARGETVKDSSSASSSQSSAAAPAKASEAAATPEDAAREEIRKQRAWR